MMRLLGSAGTAAVLWLLMPCDTAVAEIYKIVDRDGNVVYTDQAPADGTPPMDLPELSVVTTEPVAAPAQDTPAEGESGEVALTRRELRRMYSDFRITQPAQEQTFWGTENTVVVSWGASTPLQEDMSVRLLVDGQPRPAGRDSMLALTLDRGEHVVQAELLDGRGRRLLATEPVRFFVHQGSENFNRAQPQPGSGQ